MQFNHSMRRLDQDFPLVKFVIRQQQEQNVEQAEGRAHSILEEQDASSNAVIQEVDELDDCAVCQDQMITARRFPSCGHHFHQFCTIQLFQNGVKNCPICRTEIRFSASEDAQAFQPLVPEADEELERARQGLPPRMRNRFGNAAQ